VRIKKLALLIALYYTSITRNTAIYTSHKFAKNTQDPNQKNKLVFSLEII